MATATETYRYSRLRVRVFEVDVPAVAVGRTVYFPMRALCKILGIAAQMQVEKLRHDGRYAGALRELPIPTIKGLREATCIRKTEAARWLSEIDTARCALTARGPLARFQSELFAAADRWLFGDTSDVVYDPGAKSDKPITGTLRLGDCPRCGLPLCLVMDATGSHLVPERATD
jgi:hypothetical protein